MPLAHRWPSKFHGPALCIGAAMPDVVDGLFGIFRGHLGQWYGHSLIGLFILCWPGGAFFTWGAGILIKDLGSRFDRLMRLFIFLSRMTAYNPGHPAGKYAICLSTFIGAYSHLVFDLISHGTCLWFLPFEGDIRLFPEWWYNWATLDCLVSPDFDRRPPLLLASLVTRIGGFF